MVDCEFLSCAGDLLAHAFSPTTTVITVLPAEATAEEATTVEDTLRWRLPMEEVSGVVFGVADRGQDGGGLIAFRCSCTQAEDTVIMAAVVTVVTATDEEAVEWAVISDKI